jgi:hypothetical protein
MRPLAHPGHVRPTNGSIDPYARHSKLHQDPLLISATWLHQRNCAAPSPCPLPVILNPSILLPARCGFGQRNKQTRQTRLPTEDKHAPAALCTVR